jgi:hypothetical protein
MDEGDLEAYPDMAFGAIVAIVELADCLRLNDLPVSLRHNQHANGPWCWVLSHLQRIGPIPAKGAQGLWEWNAPVVNAATFDTAHGLKKIE